MECEGTITVQTLLHGHARYVWPFLKNVNVFMKHLCQPYPIKFFCFNAYSKCHVKLCDYQCKHSFIHSIGMCRLQWFLVLLRSFFHSSLLYTLSFHPFPSTSLPSSLTSSCHLFLGLPLNLVVPKFVYNTLLGIQFSSTLFTCPNQRNLFNLIVSSIVGFLTLA